MERSKETPYRSEPEAEEMISRLETLDPFSRMVYTYACLLTMIGGTTLKTTTAKKPYTATEAVLDYLQKIGAHDWETGKTTNEIAKATKYSQISIQKAIANLLERGLVRQEQRGRSIRYYLPI